MTLATVAARADDGTPIVRAGAERELPRLRSIPRDFKPFVDDVARQRRLNAAMRDHADAERRRTEAAGRPLTVIPPTRMSEVEPRSNGLYRPSHWPRQLPGRGRWPAHDVESGALQEASVILALGIEEAAPRGPAVGC